MKWQLVAALAFAFPLASQTPGGSATPPAPGTQQPAPSTEQARVDQRAQTMRSQIEHGRQVQLHVRVSVKLKNGNRLLGVVKDGRMVERVDGLRFVEAQAKDRGAGIRLWYTGGTRNFVFVPFTDLADYEVLARLSNKQLAAIESEMAIVERRNDANTMTAAPAPQGETAQPAAGDGTPAPAEDPAASGDGLSAGSSQPATGKANPQGKDAPSKDGKAAKSDDKGLDAKVKSESEQQKQWLALLQDYPPAGGWDKARRDEIAKRKVVVGATPTPREQRFVEQYEHWLKACQAFKVGPGAPTEEPDADATAEEKRRSRRK